jgi:hypothetical protein
MSYTDQANLAYDGDFQRRLQACITQEAAVTRPPDDPLGHQILISPTDGVAWFMPIVSSSQQVIDAFTGGGSDAVPDQMILAEAQAAWQRVSDLHPPA